MTAVAKDYTDTRTKERPKCDVCGERMRLGVVMSGRAASLRVCDACLDEAAAASADAERERRTAKGDGAQAAKAFLKVARDYEPAGDLDVMDVGIERG